VLNLPSSWLGGVNGFSLEVAGLADTLLIQELVPAQQLGRIASLDALFAWFLTPVAFAIAGWGTERLGPQWVFLVGATLAVWVALLALAHPGMRRFD
jgi:MFS family permease